MTDRSPKVSIGLPVRNGERYVREAVDSLLGQTFGDFELIICDNASTDATPDICRAYERADGRVRYQRNRRDIGPAANYNSCFELSRGQYFRWHAYDDICLPSYLQRCVEALDADPTVVNCHTRTRVINPDGNYMGDYQSPTRDGAAARRVSTRFGRMINVSHRRHAGFEVFGLMRRDVIATTSLHRPFAHGDRVFLVRMGLRGRFHEIPEFLFLSRRHPAQSMAGREGASDRPHLSRLLGPGPIPGPEWWDPSTRGKIVFPDWNLLGEYIAAINEVPMSAAERVRCRLQVARWLVHFWPKLARDVAFAGERLLMRGRMNGRLANGNGNGHANGNGNGHANGNGNGHAPAHADLNTRAPALAEDDAAQAGTAL